MIPPSSWYGTLLKGVFNFSPATTKLEATVWLLYAVPTLALFIRRIRSRGTAAAARTSTTVSAER
jgi:high-affinity iron transporter